MMDEDDIKSMRDGSLDLLNLKLRIMRWVSTRPEFKAFNLLEVMTKFHIARDVAYRMMDSITINSAGSLIKAKYGMRTIFILITNLNGMRRSDYDRLHTVIGRVKLSRKRHKMLIKKSKRGENNG